MNKSSLGPKSAASPDSSNVLPVSGVGAAANIQKKKELRLPALRGLLAPIVALVATVLGLGNLATLSGLLAGPEAMALDPFDLGLQALNAVVLPALGWLSYRYRVIAERIWVIIMSYVKAKVPSSELGTRLSPAESEEIIRLITELLRDEFTNNSGETTKEVI